MEVVNRPFVAAVVFALVAFFCAHAARAQPAAEREARADFDNGVEMASKERWEEAVDLFRRSYRGARRAETAMNLCVALYRLGRYREASATAADLLKEHDDIDAVMRTKAQELRSEAATRVVSLAIVVHPEQASIEIDGENVPAAGARRAVRIDPGRRVISVSAAGHRPQRIERTFEPGEGASVRIDLVPLPVTSRATTARSARPRPPAHKSTSSTPYWLMGTGAVVLVGATIVGVVALKKDRDVVDQCGKEPCDPSLEDDADNAKQLGTIADVAGAVGLATLGTGLVLWLTRDRAEPRRPIPTARLDRAGGLVSVAAHF